MTLLKINWLLLSRSPHVLLWGLMIYASTTFTGHYLYLDTKISHPLQWLLLNFSVLLFAPSIMYEEQNKNLMIHYQNYGQLFSYGLIKVGLNTILFYSISLIITLLAIGQVAWFSFFPIAAILILSLTLSIIFVKNPGLSMLTIIIMLPLIIPVMIMTCVLSTEALVAVQFFCGWMLVQIIIYKIVCDSLVIK